MNSTQRKLIFFCNFHAYKLTSVFNLLTLFYIGIMLSQICLYALECFLTLNCVFDELIYNFSQTFFDNLCHLLVGLNLFVNISIKTRLIITNKSFITSDEVISK